MKFIKTDIEGLYIVEPTIHKDDRGYFFESHNENVFRKNGFDIKFVQDNRSYSSYGCIRGLHMQKDEFAQTKMISVLSGKILDTVVDLRKDSKTFKKSFSIELDAEKKLALLIPKYFLHGLSVLSETAEIMYKVDSFYAKDSEIGVMYNDLELAIDWKIPRGKEVISAKDKKLLSLEECIKEMK